MYRYDPGLEQFATDTQWKRLVAWHEHGTAKKAGAALGVSNKLFSEAFLAVKLKASNAGYAPEFDLTHRAAPGFNVKGTSTLYDKEGNLKIQWVKTSQDKEQQEIAFRAAIEAFTEDLPRVELIPMPETGSDQLMACYPVGDHHMGMLAWHKETGVDYDLQIAENLLMGATNHLIQMAPACETCTIVFLGDFMHYDSFTPETPTSRNKLDADSR